MAVLRMSHWNGSSTGADNNIDENASGSTMKFGLDDTTISTTAITIPGTATYTYSWYKALCLYCTDATGGTSISNRKIWWDGSQPSGIVGQVVAATSYTQASGSNKPDDTASPPSTAPATPWTGASALATAQGSALNYDSSAHTVTISTRNGDLALVAIGVNNGASPGSAVVLPDFHICYDEA